jgi:hypothetical protein
MRKNGVTDNDQSETTMKEMKLMFQKLSGSSGNVLAFKIGDNITGEDVHEMGKIMSEAIAASGKIRLLMEIEGFRHMEPDALLEKLKFARDHARGIERTAVVSDRTWIKSWVKVGWLLTVLTHTEVEHFHRSEMEAAWEWVRQ